MQAIVPQSCVRRKKYPPVRPRRAISIVDKAITQDMHVTNYSLTCGPQRTRHPRGCLLGSRDWICLSLRRQGNQRAPGYESQSCYRTFRPPNLAAELTHPDWTNDR